MFKSMFKITMVSICYIYVLGVGSSVYAMDKDLVGLLTESLSVTNLQRECGAGAIFKAASQNMSVEDFTKVSNALPEVQSLMKSVPTLDSGSGSLGSLSSAFSKSGGSVSSLAGLASTFSQLDLGGDMVQQFVPIILNYAQNKGGDVVSNLLKMALQ